VDARKTVTINGDAFTICGRSSDPYFDHLTLDDHTNDFLLNVSRSLLAKDAVVFDIGANLGLSTVMMATSAPSGKIFSFEPSPSIYPYLEKTVAENFLKHCVTLPIALGEAPGELSFFDNPTSASASHLVVGDRSLGGSNYTVKVSTVDDFVFENNLERLDMMKIDVEGFELDVLKGANKTLALLKPAVFLEFNSFTLIAYGNQNPRHVLENLMTIFAHIYRFENGKMQEIRDEESVLGFIHGNLVRRGCVDDLYCCQRKL